ncbi:MAG: SHOCT domain-containing protein [Actinobacteria bacterium]|nr:MAG: SHOCT domain-containing protein [Actinomycetota bacterium]
MFRRRRPLMRAAMVGGAGYYAGKKIQQGREEDAGQDEVETQQAAAPSAGGMSNDMIDQLGKLGQLHEQGVLTDDEFAAQKQKLLEST